MQAKQIIKKTLYNLILSPFCNVLNCGCKIFILYSAIVLDNSALHLILFCNVFCLIKHTTFFHLLCHTSILFHAPTNMIHALLATTFSHLPCQTHPADSAAHQPYMSLITSVLKLGWVCSHTSKAVNIWCCILTD